MKKSKYIILLALLVLGTNVTYAQTSSTTNKLEPRKDFIEAKKAIKIEVKTDIQTIRDKAKSDLQLQKQNEIKNLLIKNGQRVVSRLTATIERLQNISDRIVTRIEKIKATGKNTTTAEKYISDAKISITSARTNLDLLKNTVALASNANITASSTIIIVKDLRKMAQNVEKNIQATRVYLVKSLANLKTLSPASVNATSTNSTN